MCLPRRPRTHSYPLHPSPAWPAVGRSRPTAGRSSPSGPFHQRTHRDCRCHPSLPTPGRGSHRCPLEAAPVEATPAEAEVAAAPVVVAPGAGAVTEAAPGVAVAEVPGAAPGAAVGEAAAVAAAVGGGGGGHGAGGG